MTNIQGYPFTPELNEPSNKKSSMMDGDCNHVGGSDKIICFEGMVLTLGRIFN